MNMDLKNKFKLVYNILFLRFFYSVSYIVHGRFNVMFATAENAVQTYANLNRKMSFFASLTLGSVTEIAVLLNKQKNIYTVL